MSLVFDVTEDWERYEGRCVLNQKYKTFMVYGKYDKAQRWKAVGAFNVKDDTGEWYCCAKNVEILVAMAKIRGPIALDKAASDRFRTLYGALEGSRAADADNDIPIPEGLAYLGYQKAGVKYALDKFAAGQRGVLIGDDMGLGKSAQFIAISNSLQEIKNILVVAPASLRINWSREFNKFSTRDWKYWISLDNEPCPADTTCAIVNYDRVQKHPELMEREWDIVCFDESHYLKNSKAKRTQLCFGYWDKSTKSLVPGLAQKSKKVVCLTGTPILNKPWELWTTICALAPGRFGNFKKFADRYCGAYEDRWAYHYDGASNLEELQLKLRQMFMVRRLKKDVLKELPAKIRQVIEIAPNGCSAAVAAEKEKWAEYEEKLEDIRTSMDLAKAAGNEAEYNKSVGRLREVSQLAFTEMSEERHRLAVAKAPYVAEHAINVLENVAKVVIFVWHQDVVDIICEALKEYNPVVFTGDTNVANKQKAVDSFQNDDNVRVFIGNIRAAGVGLTLTAGHVAIFGELAWTPGEISQAEDRLHRIGQTDTVLVHHLVIDGSFDAILAKTLVEKQRIIDAGLDNPTEIEVPTIPKPKGENLPWIFPEVPAEKKEIILTGLRTLAGFCDGARALDGHGFNKFDTRKGKFLAALSSLTDGQAVLGAMLVNKYRGQLGGEKGEFCKTAKEVMALKAKKATANAN